MTDVWTGVTIVVILLVIVGGLILSSHQVWKTWPWRKAELPASPAHIISALASVDKFDPAPPEAKLEGLQHVFLPELDERFGKWIAEENGGVVQRVEGGANVWLPPEYHISNEDVANIDIRKVFGIGAIYDEVFLRLLIVVPNGKVAAIIEEHDESFVDGKVRKRAFLFFPKTEFYVNDWKKFNK